MVLSASPFLPVYASLSRNENTVSASISIRDRSLRLPAEWYFVYSGGEGNEIGKNTIIRTVCKWH